MGIGERYDYLMIEYGLTMFIYNLFFSWIPRPSQHTKKQIKRASLIGLYGLLLFVTRSK
jgi:hypothetical protein